MAGRSLDSGKDKKQPSAGEMPQTVDEPKSLVSGKN